MKSFRVLLLCAFVGLSVQLSGQDIHWSLFEMSPLSLNPALSGAYEGSFRVGGIYRDQFRSIISDRFFATPSVFVDAPVITVFKRHWLGAGVLMLQDKAGIGNLEINTIQFSGAFHYVMDKKSNNVLTIGIQGGQINRKLDTRLLSLADELDRQINNLPGAGTEDPILQGATELDRNTFDLSAGVLLRSKIDKENTLTLGISARHLLKPKYNLATQNTNRPGADLNRRFIAHARLDYQLEDKWSIAPTAYFTALSPANQFQFQGWGGYQLKEDIRLNFGLGYRFGDAGELLLGMDYKDLRVALSYDLTLSSLREANDLQGGFEISAWYVFKIYKKPDVKPTILCPHL